MPDNTTRYDPADDNGKPVYAAALASAFRALRTNLSEVAVTGDYDDLVDKPVIPDETSDLINDSGFITEEDIPYMDYNDIDWIVAH